jgi:hypothetical protein
MLRVWIKWIISHRNRCRKRLQKQNSTCFFCGVVVAHKPFQPHKEINNNWLPIICLWKTPTTNLHEAKTLCLVHSGCCCLKRSRFYWRRTNALTRNFLGFPAGTRLFAQSKHLNVPNDNQHHPDGRVKEVVDEQFVEFNLAKPQFPRKPVENSGGKRESRH